MDTPRTDEEIGRAWRALAAVYLMHAADPVVAGARAAAEWTCGDGDVASPIKLERIPATLDRARDESHYAAMTIRGILPGGKDYARGVAAWMFWWTGLRELPPWLRRYTAAA